MTEPRPDPSGGPAGAGDGWGGEEGWAEPAYDAEHDDRRLLDERPPHHDRP